MKKLKQFAVVFSIMVVVVILTTISSPKLENKNYQSIDIGWNISINDKAYLNESLSTFRFPLAEKGDRITLENSLSDGNVSNPILKLYTIHSEIHVFLEGEEIYSYGKERNSQGKLLGYV